MNIKQDFPEMPKVDPKLTYLTTDKLAERIHYDARTIRTRLKDTVLIEGVHYIRPFGGRRILFVWERIERDMHSFSTEAPNEAKPPKEKKVVVPTQKDLKWSPVEDMYLRGAWGEVGKKQTAVALGRTLSSVAQRALQLGLTLPETWTESELKLMQEHYLTEGTSGLLMRVNKTKSAIRTQAKKMGLLCRPKHDPWTQNEDDILRLSVGKMPLRKICEVYFQDQSKILGQEFSRTYAAVAQRCAALGITLSRSEASAFGRT